MESRCRRGPSKLSWSDEKRLFTPKTTQDYLSRKWDLFAQDMEKNAASKALAEK